LRFFWCQPAPWRTEEIKIGVIYPLTGGAAAAGRELRAGAELAAEIANSVMADLP
jgi:branched-chain amino acid transport system substrate-binding protein